MANSKISETMDDPMQLDDKSACYSQEVNRAGPSGLRSQKICQKYKDDQDEQTDLFSAMKLVTMEDTSSDEMSDSSMHLDEKSLKPEHRTGNSLEALTQRMHQLFPENKGSGTHVLDYHPAMKEALQHEYGLLGVENASDSSCMLSNCVMRTLSTSAPKDPSACDHDFILCWGCALKYLETFDIFHRCPMCGIVIRAKF